MQAHVQKKHAGNALLCAAAVYFNLGQLPDAYKSTEVALELTPEDPHVLYHHAKYTAKMGYEFIGLLKECIYKDPNFLIAADRDDMFSDVKGTVNQLSEDLRDEKRNVVKMWKQKIDFARKEAEVLGINDFTSLDDRLLDEINKLYTRNSYLDLLKAEQIARKAYKESVEDVEEWIKDKEVLLNKLKTKEKEIQEKSVWAIGGSYLLSYFLYWMLIPYAIVSKIRKTRKLNALRSEIEALRSEIDALARLSNMKDNLFR